MNRLLWGIAFLVLAAAGGWAQSTWRGQAEVWPAATAPADGFVAAANEFPRNSLLTVENYRTKKTVQVRVVAALPAGSAALVLLNAKAAQALDIKAGDAPLVGVRLDPTGVEQANNPDPDVNPLAPTPAVPAPAVAPVLPLPALAAPETAAEPTPLAVADEGAEPTPVTPGKKVFVTTRESEPVTSETPVEAEVPVTAPVPEVVAVPEPVTAPVVPTPAPEVVAVPEPLAPVVEAPSATPSPAVAAPSEPPVPSPAAPVVAAPVAVAPVVTVPVLRSPAPPASAWVSVPGKLEGAILGQVSVLPSLEHGKSYVQVGAFATEAEVMTALATVKTYVPLALYQAPGEKNPWRVVVASAPKAQLGLLLMHFRSQGFRTASVVRG